MYGPELRDHYIATPQTPLSVSQLTPPGELKCTFNLFMPIQFGDRLFGFINIDDLERP